MSALWSTSVWSGVGGSAYLCFSRCPIGHAQLALKQYPAAQHWFDAALKIDPTNLKAREGAIPVYAFLGWCSDMHVFLQDDKPCLHDLDKLYI
jgi:hypothetical protein